jgi:putative PIN family toxin of toxin-antitoxin system
LTTEILSEYTEIIEQKANVIVANNIAEMLLNLENLSKIEIYFDWKLIEADPDDNKYVAAAIAGSADYLVSNDRHFNVLNNIGFPKINVIDIDTFFRLILTE